MKRLYFALIAAVLFAIPASADMYQFGVSGWTGHGVDGNGIALVQYTTATSAVGPGAIQMQLTGTTSTATFESACMTDGIGADLYVQAWVKGTGTGSLNIVIEEYDAADCTTSLQDDAILTTYDTSANWELKGDIVAAATWHADTSSYKLRFLEDGDDGVLVQVDAVEAYAGSEPRPGFCGSDTSASTVCTSSVPYDSSPISADGALTVRLTARSPWAGTELTGTKYILNDGLFSGANTIVLGVLAATDEPAYYIDDAASAALYTESNVLNWAANTDYSLQYERNGVGGMGLFWDSVWNTTTAGAGTGHRGAAQPTLYFGGESTTGGDVWLRDIKVYRRKMR